MVHDKETLKIKEAVKKINDNFDGCRITMYWSRRSVAFQVKAWSWGQARF